MPSLAFRKASICSRFSFSASCTLVVNPQHATRSRLILYWKLPPPSGSSCIGKDFAFSTVSIRPTIQLSINSINQEEQNGLGSHAGLHHRHRRSRAAVAERISGCGEPYPEGPDQGPAAPFGS